MEQEKNSFSNMDWSGLDMDRVFKALGSSPDGLSSPEIAERSARFGPNQLSGKGKKPVWRILVNQFKDFMIVVLIAAAVISGIAGDTTDTIIILLIVVLNAAFGFVQEYRAEKAMELLKKLAAPRAQVIRDGHPQQLAAADLVPGDVALLEAGSIVPADLRLFEVHSLRAEESSLTGESIPVDKNIAAPGGRDLPLGDRVNMAYKSTTITNGRGKGVVVATGMETELGKIAAMLDEDEGVTPLQKRLTEFGRRLSLIILAVCLALFGIGLLRGEAFLDMLLVSISLAVAAIPEALPALITIALSLGARRLVNKNVLVRKLPAVETLGSVTYICTDKTGTLTQNRMHVEQVVPADGETRLHEDLPLLECCMGLNHDVTRPEQGDWQGDPTEIAAVEYVYNENEAAAAGLSKQFPRVGELPFDSDRKCMTTVHEYGDQFISITKGAAEMIAAVLSPQEKNSAITKQAAKMAAGGMRVLAYGYRIWDELPEEPWNAEQIEQELRFAGLMGMIDPPREEAKEAIGECRTAGIRPVMITGDHKETATAIARDIGLLDQGDLVLTGQEMNALQPDELAEKVEAVRVYARVSPKQKLDIVRALQKKAHFVAMTGDGVNDAPSLKRADIGIAMGITGTDVSKEAARMILLDDNFATIVKAIKEGRRIYDNIRKFVKYILTCNTAEILIIFLAPILGLPIPLLPVHILWINLVTDGLPGLALSAEKQERDIMKRRPRKTNESLFADGTSYHIIWVGCLMAAIVLGIQAWCIHTENGHWQTIVFTVLSLAQLGHVFAIRSDRDFIYKKGFFSNLPLLGAIFLTVVLQLCVVYLPFGNQVFRTQPLSLQELLFCFLGAALIFIAVEMEKWGKILLGKGRSLKQARQQFPGD